MLIETHGLTKRYGRFVALNDFTFGVNEGEVFGLLGPNGAGKTTLLRTLLGFIRPTAGSATIAGLDCYRESVAVHKILAYLPGDARLFRRMRGREVLKFFADVRPGGSLSRSLLIAARLELDITRRVAMMSTGMRQKLALVAAFSADVPIIVLDEPTSNLDPTMRSVVANMVAEAQQAGRTVLFSSHVMSEVEEVCDRVVILRAGELVHTQEMAQLRRQHRIKARLQGEFPAVPESLQSGLSICRGENGDVVMETPGELAPLLGWLATLPLEDLRIEPLGLRAIYDYFHDETLRRGSEPVALAQR